MPGGEALLKKATELSKIVIASTGKEGQDAISQDVKQLKIEWDSLQHLMKETQKSIDKCNQAWNDFMESLNKMNNWEGDFEKKLNNALSVTKMTPDHLENCRVQMLNKYFVYILKFYH